MIATSERHIFILRECGARLSTITKKLAAAVAPGIATLELDRLAESLILSSGGTPVFKGYRAERKDTPFPASICTSVNDEVVHAIPRADRILREGDILGIDIGMRYPASAGLITDMAVTVPVGVIGPEVAELLHATKESLDAGVRALKVGGHLGDVGAAIQARIEADGFGVVRELVGHGVGKHLHEDPYVPNYGRPGEGIVVREGLVIALEPMATAGDPEVLLDRDGWTWRTKDKSLSAHFEHTIIVAETGAEILTK